MPQYSAKSGNVIYSLNVDVNEVFSLQTLFSTFMAKNSSFFNTKFWLSLLTYLSDLWITLATFLFYVNRIL